MKLQVQKMAEIILTLRVLDDKDKIMRFKMESNSSLAKLMFVYCQKAVRRLLAKYMSLSLNI
jgi:hypothetical protein